MDKQRKAVNISQRQRTFLFDTSRLSVFRRIDKGSRMKRIAGLIVCLIALAGCSTKQSSTTQQTTGNLTKASRPVGAPLGSLSPESGPGGSGQVITGTGVYVLTNNQILNAGRYISTKKDQNVIRAQGHIRAMLKDVSIFKVKGHSTNNGASRFYGLNAAVLALDHARLTINGGSIKASAEGATGVFAYNQSTVHINNTHINVSGGHAGGIDVAGGGTIYAKNLTVHATMRAAIRSDRGGGKIVVAGGTYTTRGSLGAPVIYSMADIQVHHATLISHTAEAVVVEGSNSVTITDSQVSGNMHHRKNGMFGQNIHNVMLYHRVSGDARTGTNHFTMQGGSLVSKQGDMFYVTNTDSVIHLKNVHLTLAPHSKLLLVAGNNGARGWGQVGSNGGVCQFNLTEQRVSGNIQVDSISKLHMNITEQSLYKGAINTNGTKAPVTVTIDGSSTWTLTGDSYIAKLKGSLNRIHFNGHTLYINGVAVSHHA